MKKHILLLMGVILPSAVFGQGLSTETVIDFNTFEEQVQEAYPNPENQLLSVDGEAIVEIGSELFMLDNWRVTPEGSSGQSPLTRMDSYSKKVTSQERGTVLGVRARFPEWPHAGEARIKPRFSLLPFSKEGQYININNGVITNVGSIKSFSMWANGRNFNFTVGVRMSDINGKLTEFSLGSLFYIGWRRLVYNNPFYSERPFDNIRSNTRIYPTDVPLLRFDSIMVYRPGNEAGGNFVGYFGNIQSEYSPYLTEVSTDINDEETWGVIQEIEEKRAQKINKTLYEEILQYEYAKQRVAVDRATDDATANTGDATVANP